MKIIILVLCALVLVVSGKFAAVESIEECLKENGLKTEDLENLGKEVDPKLRCLMACYLEKIGVIKDGEINKESLKTSVLRVRSTKENEDKVSKLIDTCIQEAPDTLELCLRAHQIIVCLKDGLDKVEDSS